MEGKTIPMIHQRNKKLRAIRVKYRRKNPAPKVQYNLDFNIPQFSGIDQLRALLQDVLSLDVTNAVIIRASVAQFTKELQQQLENNPSKAALKDIARQLEIASQDRLIMALTKPSREHNQQ